MTRADARADSADQAVGGWVGGGAGRKKYGSVPSPPSKVAGRRPGSRVEEPGKVTKLVQPGHQWLQVGRVLEFAGAGSGVCTTPVLEPEGSLNAQASAAHAMFSVSSDKMRHQATVRTMAKGYYKPRSVS